MDKKKMDNGKRNLCREMEEILGKAALTAGDLENLHKLSDTYKNILKIEMLEEDGEEDEMYSERRDAMGRYSREYDETGNSYRSRRGTHYVRGHYSRDDGMGGGTREMRGRYSRADGKDQMLHELGEMMEGANDTERHILERAMQEIRRA